MTSEVWHRVGALPMWTPTTRCKNSDKYEAYCTCTIEHATLQLQALVNQMPTTDTALPLCLHWLNALLLPTR